MAFTMKCLTNATVGILKNANNFSQKNSYQGLNRLKKCQNNIFNPQNIFYFIFFIKIKLPAL